MANSKTQQKLKLSILDLASIHHGETATSTLQQVANEVKLAERLGYTRYWFAEHHNTKYQMSTSPEILIAHTAALTERIRIGAGGIMLPNHSSLKVAEQFSLLEALHPGRIDLGIGRAPGTDIITAWALRRTRDAVKKDEFPEQLKDLLSYFSREFPEDHPFRDIIPSPDPALVPKLVMLGSSDGGMRYAAEQGLAFAFAAHISPHLAVPMLRAYREKFQPSRWYDQPESILSVIVITADTEEEAWYYAAPAELQWLRWRTGQTELPPPSLEEANQYRYTPYEETIRLANRQRLVIGSIDQVEQRLRQMADETMADEIMILNMITDRAARLKAMELLARLMKN